MFSLSRKCVCPVPDPDFLEIYFVMVFKDNVGDGVECTWAFVRV